MSAQLECVQALAAERRGDEGLYPFQREMNQTFADVLCYLIGLGAISDADLDTALRLAREGAVRTRAARARRSQQASGRAMAERDSRVTPPGGHDA